MPWRRHIHALPGRYRLADPCGRGSGGAETPCSGAGQCFNLERADGTWQALTCRIPARDCQLIEVSIPLDAINRASAGEKSVRHGHPSTLHLRWARRPLTACRAVLFAQLVDDPLAWPEEFPTEEGQKRERARLHAVIAEMVPWEATKRRADPEKILWTLLSNSAMS